MAIEKLRVDLGSSSGAPYSTAIVAGEFVFVSGQLPIDQLTGEMTAGGIEEQTAQALANLELALVRAGADMTKLVKTTVYLLTRADWAAMNEVYIRFTGAIPPARTAVIVSEMAPGARVEIDAI